jgi:hypothetical protein
MVSNGTALTSIADVIPMRDSVLCEDGRTRLVEAVVIMPTTKVPMARFLSNRDTPLFTVYAPVKSYHHSGLPSTWMYLPGHSHFRLEPPKQPLTIYNLLIAERPNIVVYSNTSDDAQDDNLVPHIIGTLGSNTGHCSDPFFNTDAVVQCITTFPDFNSRTVTVHPTNIQYQHDTCIITQLAPFFTFASPSPPIPAGSA